MDPIYNDSYPFKEKNSDRQVQKQMWNNSLQAQDNVLTGLCQLDT